MMPVWFILYYLALHPIPCLKDKHLHMIIWTCGGAFSRFDLRRKLKGFVTHVTIDL